MTAAPSPALYVPIGNDASPCDLLHETPLPRLDCASAADALSFAFVSGDGDVLSRLPRHTPVAPSAFRAEDFAHDLQLSHFVERCLPVWAQGRQYAGYPEYRLRVLCSPPSDRSHTYFRQRVCAELASSPRLAAGLEALYVALTSFTERLGRASVGHQDGIDRRLALLTSVRSIVDCLCEEFSGATSGLRRLHELGATLRTAPGYQRMCELLSFEEQRAEVDLRLGIGFDGRVRSFQTLERREHTGNRFYSSPWGRAWTALLLLLRGYKPSSSEVLSRLIDHVFAGLEAHVVHFFQLRADVEVYLSALSFRGLALRAGLPTCLPELSDRGGRRFDGLFNPWLVAEQRPCRPCDVELLEHQHLTFITGPNSGGKTRLLQSLGLCQLLAQCGMFVPAASAELRWSGGLFASLLEHVRIDQKEGRLGTELLRIRKLFERARSGAVVIMDELCSGTNPSEGEELLSLVVEVLAELEPQAYITTHFLQFAAALQASQYRHGFLMTELNELEQPTYGFVAGVARTSLAHRVAERLGVTRESLTALVQQNNPRIWHSHRTAARMQDLPPQRHFVTPPSASAPETFSG